MLSLALAGLLAQRAPIAAPDGGRAPPGLTCLPSWYAGTVKWQPDGGWGLQLDNGTFLPWDSGRTHRVSDPESEEVAELHDIYVPPYPQGPIVPIDTSDAGPIEDPGRARVEQLFLTTYGANKAEVQARLDRVRFFGVRYAFHQKAAPALERVVERLEKVRQEHPEVLPFLRHIGGTWAWRTIKRSQNLSTHAFGIAIDLNVDRSHYWRWTFRGQPMVWKNKVPQAVVDAFEAEGFIWGGRWKHFDTMHFEYRPELLSSQCRGY